MVVALQSSKFPRSKSGIPGYDELVDGGFHKGTVNTITGSSGTGKTVFAGQFINYGIKMGEKGMIITPSESAEYLKREMMSSFGWDFSNLEKEGKLAIVDVTDPVLRLQKSIDVDPVDFLINFQKAGGEKAGGGKARPALHRRPDCLLHGRGGSPLRFAP